VNPLCDPTHDPARLSWVPSANAPGAEFPVQNLPMACFMPPRVDAVVGDDDQPYESLRVGVAIGQHVLDLKLASTLCPWDDDVHPLLEPLANGDLSGFMALGRPAWKRVRAALSAALSEGSDQAPFLDMCLWPLAQVRLTMPCRVGDFTDFFAGIHHARATGAMARPENPLLPNYQWVPVGYHGRASSVDVASLVRRPNGQLRTAQGRPVFGASRRLDYELELGLWVGTGNALGEPVRMDQAEDHLFGITPLNDWSARDIQAWESLPLGPFLAKSFATTVSPWVVSWEALAPFRRPFVRPEGDPEPLPHLDSEFNRAWGAIDIHLEVWLRTAEMREKQVPAVRLSQSNALDAYWTPAQLLAHHTSNGCNLRRGDLLGTGTLSGARPEQAGSLLELTQGGRLMLNLPGGQTRSFLEDGDTVTLRAYCQSPGTKPIGLGRVTATVLPAR
jgi:fumarylacetoacetase